MYYYHGTLHAVYAHTRSVLASMMSKMQVMISMLMISYGMASSVPGRESIAQVHAGQSPTWFSVELSRITNDDIEVHVCGDEGTSNEGTPVELVEIHVQYT